jgi:hypothetical protein
MVEPDGATTTEAQSAWSGEPDLPARRRRRRSRLRDALIIAVALLILLGVTLAYGLLSGGDSDTACPPEHHAMGHC